MLRRVALAGASAVAAIGFGLAHAGSAGAATYLACAPGTSVPGQGSGGPTCLTLPTAIADAAASQGSDTIEMLPGTYCPIQISSPINGSIRFVGVGLAGFTGDVLDGPEAGLTTFKDSVLCGGTPLADVDVETNLGFDTLTFQNLTMDATGLSFGFYDYGWTNFVVMRDVIIQNAVSAGIKYLSGCCIVDYSLDFDNGALINNIVGAELFGFASVYDSTIAGNHTGLSLVNVEASLSGDTIAHNTTGVQPPGFPLQVIDTIVANNLQNCSGIDDWEYPAADSWNNLLESENQGCEKFDATDTVVPTISMAAVGLNGGPTPSIATPTEADAHGGSPCGLNGVDQREDVVTGTSCDVGSVQQSAVATPDVSAGGLDLGIVPVGSSTSGSVSVSNQGGGLVGVSGVSISGAGWSITSDGCTYAVMERAFDNGCSVGVSVHPTEMGTWNGTLTVHTTAGDVTAQLQSQVLLPPEITSFAPVSGPVGSPVTITGSHFTGATAVAFGGTAAQSFNVVSDTQINAVVAPGTTTGFITVTGPAGFVTSTHPFVVVAAQPPLIRTVSPGQGQPGSTVTILGQNLSGASAVTFGGIPAVTFSASSGSITVTVPPAALTGNIAVTTPGGTATSTAVYTVIPLAAPTPTITSFSPTTGIHGVQVRIRGTGLTGATSVKFNGKTAAFTVQNDTTILATVPAFATTGHITVTTSGGTATSAGTFTI